ncbi:small multi-drug export protein [Candidatus Pacearchaeota archaeon]|nr:small multi-drug export protein [Candidatus Pacearchaeota archaeon]
MDLRLLYALILTVLPVTELRVGLPLGVVYAIDNGIPVIFAFLPIVLVNIILIFFVFYFLDHLHSVFMRVGIYKRLFEKYLGVFQKRVDKFKGNYSSLGFLALVLFVGVPLPGTGAWSGCLVSWLLGLDRKKSILAISAGILIAGILILLGTLGVINFL